MPSAQGSRISFSEAIKATKLDSHAYRVDLIDSFCVGAVPNGGYAASCMLNVAGLHLSPRGQPDTLTAHFEFPNRTSIGPALVTVEEVKIGQQLSTLHLTLWQGELLAESPWVNPSASRRTILAYTTHTDLRNFSGISLPTGFETTPAAALPPVPDFDKLKANGSDEVWEEPSLPRSMSTMMRSLNNWHFYLPKQDPFAPGVLDMWIRFVGGNNIKQSALPYLADSFPYNMHTFLAAPELRQLLLSQPDPATETGEEQGRREELKERDKQRASLWFPTVAMNLEVKSALPEEGVEWLAVRITSKQIKDGRFDLDISIRDVEGELVALSNHVAMILSIERNTGKRSFGTKAEL